MQLCAQRFPFPYPRQVTEAVELAKEKEKTKAGPSRDTGTSHEQQYVRSVIDLHDKVRMCTCGGRGRDVWFRVALQWGFCRRCRLRRWGVGAGFVDVGQGNAAPRRRPA